MKVTARVEQYTIDRQSQWVKMSIAFPITFDISKSIHSLDIEVPEDTSVLDSLSVKAIKDYLSKRCKFYCCDCGNPMPFVKFNLNGFKMFCEVCKTHVNCKEL